MSARKWTIRGLAGAALACATGQTPAQTPTMPAQPAQPATATQAKPAAVVNGEPIAMADLDNLIRSFGPSPAPLTEQQQKQMREDALSMLIEDLLMQQFLRQYAPKVTPEQIAQELATMEKALAEKHKITLAEWYKQNGMTEEQWRVKMGYGLQWKAYCKATFTDAVVKQYYDENKDFFDRVQVRASHIMIRVVPEMPAADVAAAKAKLTALRQQILERKIDFATAAKQYSEYPPTQARGGDLGFFPRKGIMDETIAQTAFAMQPGNISDIVQNELGLHLVYVTERSAGEPSKFEDVKEDVRMFCVMEYQQKIATHMRKNARIEK